MLVAVLVAASLVAGAGGRRPLGRRQSGASPDVAFDQDGTRLGPVSDSERTPT